MEIGRSINRVDAVEKVTGGARYTDDFTQAPTLVAYILHSTIGHGRVVSMDTEAARRTIDMLEMVGIPGIMLEDKLVEILGAKFPCVDTGFGRNKPVDVVIRPEDVDLLAPEEGIIQGVVSHLIFKGVHYEMEVQANGFEWLVHSTDLFPVGQQVGIHVDPFDIQIMNKPESEDEEALGVNE